MWFALTAVVAASLTVGVGFVGAAVAKKHGGHAKSGHRKSSTKRSGKNAAVASAMLHCSVSLTTGPEPGSAVVDQPPAQGSQYGPIHCPTAGFGGGVAADSFTVPDSGDIVAKYTDYLGAGSINGSFDLSPQESFDISSFSSQDWSGTVTVNGGTGIYRGITGKSGTMNCTSVDSVHLTCTEAVRVKLPAGA
jgi:hypothetical protein